MATNIISAVRHCAQLHGNLKFTAIEVAHRMNSAGYGRIAYTMMGYATGYCRRTAIRHMHQLTALRVYEKTVYRLQNGYAINLYKCLLPRAAFYRAAPPGASGDSVASRLPDPTTEEKSLSLKEEIARQHKGLRFLTNPASPMYQACVEKIAALEALIQL
jgi:hypothetical protein